MAKSILSQSFNEAKPGGPVGEAKNRHIDWPLFTGLVVLSILGLVVLYSASGENWSIVSRQMIWMCLAYIVMLVAARIPPHYIQLWTPWVFTGGLLFLVIVLYFGEVGKGAQRWLDLGLFRFQPSEIMKFAVPMMVAWFIAEKTLPPSWGRILGALLIVMIPVALIAMQPDLGTALLVGSAGALVLLFAGISWYLIGGFLLVAAAVAPVAWFYYMHDYQRQRVLTFLNPESDPLGSGYHIIQSKIAIGSGGLYGKGWLNGTQSQLDFLPERSTDFIFAVYSEEFGLVGVLCLLAIYLGIVFRGLIIAYQAQTTFTRVLAGSLVLTFVVYITVNIGMVSGLLPVVGVPLPLVSYGGTSMVTLMFAFGILMSIHTHRKLLTS
ncbi:MAG TPA: rod shape-determining protein RodA [Gammaproteobacteria bacterium]|nr:rod shape-determining protein RodA [Gammaproteobacteria bacterium]